MDVLTLQSYLISFKLKLNIFLDFLFVTLILQGPIGWQSLTMHGDVDLFMNCDEVHNISEISWEALIQKHIEDELYDSSLKARCHAYLMLIFVYFLYHLCDFTCLCVYH